MLQPFGGAPDDHGTQNIARLRSLNLSDRGSTNISSRHRRRFRQEDTHSGAESTQGNRTNQPNTQPGVLILGASDNTYYVVRSSGVVRWSAVRGCAIRAANFAEVGVP